MDCTKFAYDCDGEVLDWQTTTFDVDGNVVSESVDTKELAEPDCAVETLVFSTDPVELAAFADSAFAGKYRFDGLNIEVDDALQYTRARCFDPTIVYWLSQEP